MKVLLIRANPTVVENTRLPKSLSKEVGFVPPIGLASIAAFLRTHGTQVGIIDAEAEQISLEQIRRRILRFEPEVVGITSMTPTVHDDLAVAKLAKACGAYTVVGGPQMNAMPSETLSYPFVDFGIRGEGELPMWQLVQALDQQSPFKEVPGLVYRDPNGALLMNPPYIHPDLDILPFPDRDLLPMERYSAIIAEGKMTTVCPGRGCPFQCSFCFKQPSDKTVRFRNPQLVVDEIEQIIAQYQIQEIDLVSDTLTINRSFIQAFCEELIRRKMKISWIAPTRADCVDLDLLKLMKQAGCRNLRFGIESGSSVILKRMHKETNQDTIFQAFQWAKEVGIETFAYFIIGYLGETEETIQETLDFIDKIKPDLLMFNEGLPLPATPLFRQAVEAGFVAPDYWERYVKGEPIGRIPYLFKDTDQWIRKAYRRFFFSRRFLMKQLLNFRFKMVGKYFKALYGLLRL